MIKRICLVEDVRELDFMQDLFKRHTRKGEYEIGCYPDLSHEKVYRKYLPENHDFYWLHSSTVEFDAINKIKEEQPWSKIVVRTSVKEISTVNSYLRENKIDKVLSSLDGLNEKKVIEILKDVGIELILQQEVLDKK